MNNLTGLTQSTWVVYAVVAALAYTVGRVGLPTLYQDIKHLFQGIKGAVSGAKAAVTTTPPTTTA
jgi:hypothetical protein